MVRSRLEPTYASVAARPLSRQSPNITPTDVCKGCRAEARMKTEIREKEDAGSMEAWSYAQYAGETERE